MSEAVILAYKQKMRIFEIHLTQFLIYNIKASLVSNFKSLSRLGQSLHVSSVLFGDEHLKFFKPNFGDF